MGHILPQLPIGPRMIQSAWVELLEGNTSAFWLVAILKLVSQGWLDCFLPVARCCSVAVGGILLLVDSEGSHLSVSSWMIQKFPLLQGSDTFFMCIFSHRLTGISWRIGLAAALLTFCVWFLCNGFQTLSSLHSLYSQPEIRKHPASLMGFKLSICWAEFKVP